MGSCGVSRIAADSDVVATLDGESVWRENQGQRVSALAVQQLLVLVGKAFQMAVDAGVAVRMADVDGIAEAIHVDRQSADITVGNGEDVLALHIARLDIDATMKMVWAGFTEVARKDYFVVNGRAINDWLLAISRWLIIATRHQ